MLFMMILQNVCCVTEWTCKILIPVNNMDVEESSDVAFFGRLVVNGSGLLKKGRW